MSKEKRYIELHYTLCVDEDVADKRSDELLDLLDQHCGCVSGGECDLVVGTAVILSEEQFEKKYAEEEPEEPKSRRRRKLNGKTR